eukprot:1161529-Pelagomonas_calceolata.AAC.16
MEERLFSKLDYIRNERRDMLATQSFWRLRNFTIQAAVHRWFDANKRHMAEHGRGGWRRQQSTIMEVSSSSSSDSSE